jgi:hypothetical protein
VRSRPWAVKNRRRASSRAADRSADLAARPHRGVVAVPGDLFPMPACAQGVSGGGWQGPRGWDGEPVLPQRPDIGAGSGPGPGSGTRRADGAVAAGPDRVRSAGDRGLACCPRRGPGRDELIRALRGGCAINSAAGASLEASSETSAMVPVSGHLRRLVHVQVCISRPLAAGFCVAWCHWRDRGGAGGGGLLFRLFVAAVGGGRPFLVPDAGGVEFDADGQREYVDG